jgi:choline dehydrogenase
MCATTQMARMRKTLMSLEEYDIVFVGAAGFVVASCLAEHTDASIALIEAGDMDRDPCHPYSCRAAGAGL